MKLRIVKAIPEMEEGRDACSRVQFGYINLYYDFNSSIIDGINDSILVLDRELGLDVDYIENADLMEDDEKNFYYTEIAKIRNCLNNNNNDFNL